MFNLKINSTNIPVLSLFGIYYIEISGKDWSYKTVAFQWGILSFVPSTIYALVSEEIE